MLELLFWSCALLLVWTYAGYPAVMLARARSRRPEPDAPPAGPVPVTVVVAVRNGAARVGARLRNLLEQEYPAELLDVLVVVNGSTDDSAGAAARIAAEGGRVRVLESDAAEGKAGALNRGVEAATGEVVVFADVRQLFRPDVVRRLVAAVQRPGMGAVSGRLVIEEGGDAAVQGVTRYWSFETALRQAESVTGSVVGVTGAIYAIRRRLYHPIPPGTILDDVYEPLRIAMAGHRVGFEPEAVAVDVPSEDRRSEYRRRVRTLLGNLQLVALVPDLLDPRRNPMLVRFVSHKLLRVVSPLLLLGVLGAGLLVGEGAYLLGGLAVLALIGLGAVGMLVHVRGLELPAAFLMMQLAALEAMFRRRRGAADVWTR